MPQRKGRQSNKNKKNKGRAGFGKNSRNPQSRPATTNNASVDNRSGGNYIQGQRPNFDGYEEHINKTIQKSFGTIYSRYKAATKRFCEYMIEETPDSVEGNRESVNFLTTAAEWMSETDFALNPIILKDLKLTIRMRSRVAKSIFGGGDAGHRHFLDVLIYCWTLLNPLRRLSETAQSLDEQEAAKENRYEALLQDDEDDEMEEDIFPSIPVPRPIAAEPEIALTIDQLMKSDERHDAVIFLLALDEMMTHITNQYRGVVKQFDPAQPSAIVENLLEAAVCTNMAIQQVQQLEMDLQQQYKHLTTPYRLLSIIAMPEITKNVSKIVREHGNSKPNLEQDVTTFLGDCIESHMRNASDPSNQRETIAKDFCEKFQVNTNGALEIQNICSTFDKIILLEVPVGAEKTSRMRMTQLLGTLPSAHSWLPGMPSIGGDRAIHHTLRLLQAFGSIISATPKDRNIVPRRGFFGQSPWRPGHSRKTHDLDELFMADILPEWFLMCRKGILGNMKLPRENELCPLFVLFRQYVETPDAPVTWAFTFAMHAMLTGILETDRITHSLIDASKFVFNNYFSQLDFALYLSKQESEMSNNSANWKKNMFMVMFLKNLGLDVFGDRALWNPLCGGTILSYLCFFGNLEGGCAMIDCRSQLRIVLHLFHALKMNGIIREGQIPMLDMLHDCFKSSRGIWEGSLPQKGEFVQRFWICFGMSIADAKRMAAESRKAIQSHTIDTQNDGGEWVRRTMNPVEPAEIATCYRRICNRDFHDVVDKYHTEEQRRRAKGTDMYSFAVRANDTMDAIENEQCLLSFNLISCGALIEQFVCSLGRILQWEPLINDGGLNLGGDMRQKFVLLFAQHLLGALDFSSDPFNHEFLQVPLVQATSTFIGVFFSAQNPEKVFWFQATQKEE